VNEFRISFFRTATRTNEPKGQRCQPVEPRLRDRRRHAGRHSLWADGLFGECSAYRLQQLLHRCPYGHPLFSLTILTLISDGFSRLLALTPSNWRRVPLPSDQQAHTCAPNGDFTFDGTETGVDFADFLIGVPFFL
jgi:hypothetical protein